MNKQHLINLIFRWQNEANKLNKRGSNPHGYDSRYCSRARGKASGYLAAIKDLEKIIK